MTAIRHAVPPRTAWRATLWYVLLTAAMTWPVVTALPTGVPSDLGDPLLNCWILGWNTSHFTRALTGDWAALGELWHGNIFHPERYTLAYSELLIAQSVQALPVYLVTGNVILCYNLLFLSTFALAGLGMFLLVRAYTSDWRVAFVAGALFAFAPYRLYQASHLQVMSTQWMPFALFGFHRAAATARLRPALGGAAALVAQNLSCGYFLIYFSLFIPAFVLVELARHGRLLDRRAWIAFALAAAVVAGATLPFMSPYFALRELRNTVRGADELEEFSADTLGWVTAPPNLLVWGQFLDAMKTPEGMLFQGMAPVILAAIALVAGVRRTAQASRERGDGVPPFSRGRLRAVLPLVAGAVAVTGAIGLLTILAGGSGLHRVLGVRVRIESGGRTLTFIAVGLIVLIAVSHRFRMLVVRAASSPLGFAGAATLAAAYLSLGPVPRAGGEPIDVPLIFAWLLGVVPGLDGLRVPARFAGIAVVFIVVMASGGIRELVRWAGPRGSLVTAILLVIVLADAAMLPVPLDQRVTSATPGVLNPPATVATGRDAPRIYLSVRKLPPGSVLLELPLGDDEWEFRHVFYATVHWRPIVNGYSGYVPRSYAQLRGALLDPYRDPEVAWQRVRAAGVTHVVVHGEAYADTGPPAPYGWLQAHGAELVSISGTDRLYALR